MLADVGQPPGRRGLSAWFVLGQLPDRRDQCPASFGGVLRTQSSGRFWKVPTSLTMAGTPARRASISAAEVSPRVGGFRRLTTRSKLAMTSANVPSGNSPRNWTEGTALEGHPPRGAAVGLRTCIDERPASGPARVERDQHLPGHLILEQEPAESDQGGCRTEPERCADLGAGPPRTLALRKGDDVRRLRSRSAARPGSTDRGRRAAIAHRDCAGTRRRRVPTLPADRGRSRRASSP